MLSISIFLLYHAVVWNLFNAKLLDVQEPNYIGDLSRTGYQLKSIHYRATNTSLSKTHINFSQWKGEEIDILTIGDSFSNGAGKGENSYYQDFIASDYNLTVMNINPSLFGENYLEAIASLLSSGLLEEINPKAVIVESVGRYSLGRFAKSINWDQNWTRDEIFNDLKKSRWGGNKPKTSFITTANYHFLLYNFYYHFSVNAFDYSDVYKFTLSKPMFTVQTPSTLLLCEHDITFLNGITSRDISIMNDNFNHLADLLAQKNIRLFTMIAVDKYDLYYDYIVDNPYGKNTLFEQIRPMQRRYAFIDTKAILSPYIAKGTKDIYYADDTHWSNLASKEIVRQTNFPKIITNK